MRPLFTALAIALPLLTFDLSPVAAQHAVAEADKLHVVLVGDSRDKNSDGTHTEIGKLVREDMWAIWRTLDIGFKKAGQGHRLAVHNWYGATAASGVYNGLKNLKTGPRDVVMVIFNGHGVTMNLGTHLYHHKLTLNKEGQYLTRGKVEDLLKARKLHGYLFLSDACSGYKVKPGGGKQEQSTGPNWETIRNLFLRSPKAIHVNSAWLGQLAMAKSPKGPFFGCRGPFTMSLVQLLHGTKTYSGWKQFWPDFSAKVAENSPEADTYDFQQQRWVFVPQKLNFIRFLTHY